MKIGQPRSGDGSYFTITRNKCQLFSLYGAYVDWKISFFIVYFFTNNKWRSSRTDLPDPRLEEYSLKKEVR